VVHGPLVALLLLGAGVRRAERAAGREMGARPVAFQYRALQPLFCNEPFELHGTDAGSSEAERTLQLQARCPRGTAMRAELRWMPDLAIA